jgi:hypothetical protein
MTARRARVVAQYRRSALDMTCLSSFVTYTSLCALLPSPAAPLRIRRKVTLTLPRCETAHEAAVMRNMALELLPNIDSVRDCLCCLCGVVEMVQE